MPRPRKLLVRREETRFYHCVSRCVRRAFLCGQDHASGRSYEHRRQWVVDRLEVLATLFEIDICAYAIMSNHYHLVVRLGDSGHLSDDEVIKRWLHLFQGPLLVRHYQAGEPLTQAELVSVRDIASVWRKRLSDLSWFMKCLNEPLARRANQEDKCSGHFWESRFKSQALRSTPALLACMAYVDLNPIRAGMAKSLEASDYTSIQARIKKPLSQIGDFDESASGRHAEPAPTHAATNTPGLLEFKHAYTREKHHIHCSFRDYLALVDWTGRRIMPNKRGRIAPATPSALERLGLRNSHWMQMSTDFEAQYVQRSTCVNTS